MNPPETGQALIETAAFFFGIALLFGCLLGFTARFTARQKTLIALREAALLYSAGRLTKEETNRFAQRYLAAGSPRLSGSVIIETAPGPQAILFNLDRITVRCRAESIWTRIAGLDPYLEEQCTIKHAAHYGPPFQTLYGPPVP